MLNGRFNPTLVNEIFYCIAYNYNCSSRSIIIRKNYND